MHYVEKIGSGIKRIRNLVPDVKFDIGSNWFRVVFKRRVRFPERFPEKLSKDKIRELGREELLKILELKVGRRLVEKVGRKLVENSLKILLIILEKPEISKRELSEILGISDTAVDKHIKKLKDLRVIERVGPAKGGYWKVLK
ncbi:MAG TPA: winged helix-turn-helix transcriptional regulator [Candidatus Altiarchaeales archaeon]|nr:winged helix-turn-helix transcriptional regulator [Candidatus Altiarchaeales archaeon]